MLIYTSNLVDKHHLLILKEIIFLSLNIYLRLYYYYIIFEFIFKDLF